MCSCTQTNLTILIYFSHIDIFKAVHEGHINRSKIGNALISEIVTAFVTHTCIFFLSGVRHFLNPRINKYIHKQTNKTKVNLICFGNAKVIHELLPLNFLTFTSLMQWMPLTTSVVRLKNVRYVFTKAINVRIFSLVILF